MKKFITSNVVKSLTSFSRKEKVPLLSKQNKFGRKQKKALFTIPCFFIVAILSIIPFRLDAKIQMKYGDNLAGSISAAREKDTFLFRGNMNDVITIQAGRSGGLFWPEIKVYRPDGSLLKADTGSPSVRIKTLKLPQDGLYTILLLDGYSGTQTGTYGLSLQRIKPGVGTLISYGTNTNGNIQIAGYINAYTFKGNTNDIITMLAGRSGGLLQPRLEVYRPDGSLLKAVTGSPSVRIKTLKLPQDGLYTILLLDGYSGTQIGTYGFSLQRIKPGVGTLITYGTTTNGNIQIEGYINAYTFKGKANNIITMLAGRSGGLLQPRIEVYRPDGSLLMAVTGSPSVRIKTLKLPQDGLYTILLLDGYSGTQIGTYGLSLQRIKPGLGTPISYGAFKTGIIETSGDINAYTFDGNTSDVITISAKRTAGLLWPRIEVYMPDGTLLKADTGSSKAMINKLELPQSGLYCILILDGYSGTQIGNYRLHLFEDTTQTLLYSNQETNKEQVITGFEIIITPNPTEHLFKVYLKGINAKDKVNLKVYDASGRLIEVKNNLYTGRTLTIGERYKQGVYFMEAIQAKERRTVKIIKQ